MRILDRQYPIAHILLIIAIIAAPLFIIYHYEGYSLDIADTNGYLRRIEELKRRVDGSAMNLTFTQKYIIQMKELPAKLEAETTDKQTKRLLDSIETNIQQNNVIGIYSNFIRVNIINVLISSQLWTHRKTIRSHVLQSLAYINSSLQMSLGIIEWKQGILLQTQQTSIVLIFQEFRPEFIDENLANRLKTGEYRNSYYLIQFAKQLRSLPSFSHCKYTNYDCNQKTLFFVQHSSERQESYWKIDKEIVIVDQTEAKIIFNAVSEILSVNQIMRVHQENGISCRQMYAEIQRRAYLQNTKSTLNYLSFIFQENNINWPNKITEWLKKPEKMIQFIKKGRYRSPYIHNQAQLQQIDKLLKVISHSLNGQPSQKLKFDPLSDNIVGVIDTFPNEFRIGVYIPLLVLFITPLMNKLLELIKFTIKGRTAQSS